MSDQDLEQIRRARLQQLQQQQQRGGGGQDSEQALQKQQDDQRSALLAQILEPNAADRLGRIRLVKESRATEMENRLMMLARTGQLRQKVTEDMLKQLLGQALDQRTEQDRQHNIVVDRRRRRGAWEDDEDDELEELMKEV